MVPLSLAHRIVETHGKVKDVWRIQHPRSSIGAAVDEIEQARGKPIPTADFNLTQNGATCDSVLNTWRWSKQQQKRLDKGEDRVIDPNTEDPRAKRLDYIFLGDALSQTRVEQVRVGMTMRHPKLQCSLSDHFAVEATISQSDQGPFTKDPHRLGAMLSSGELDTPEYLPVETYDSILAMIHKYTLRQRNQRRLRLTHFVGQFTVAIGCLVAVWWSPRNFVSFILMLISSLGLAAGCVDGLIGGLFVGSEIRALKEFEWEIENAKARAAAAEGTSTKTRDVEHV